MKDNEIKILYFLIAMINTLLSHYAFFYKQAYDIPSDHSSRAVEP